MYPFNSIQIKLLIFRTFFLNMNIAEYTTSITRFQTDPKFHVTCKKKLLYLLHEAVCNFMKI